VRKALLVAVTAVWAAAAPASAVTIVYTATLGPEVTGATGTGATTITLDTVANTLRVEATFSGLSGTTTVAHIHCCTTTPGAGTAGVATAVPTFPGFPAGVQAGSYDMTFDLGDSATYNPAFVTANGDVAGAAAALIAGLNGGVTYLNIHTMPTFTGGEIRGFPAAVPEPAAGALGLLGLGAALRAARRRATGTGSAQV
jgi:hypothetical protein